MSVVYIRIRQTFSIKGQVINIFISYRPYCLCCHCRSQLLCESHYKQYANDTMGMPVFQ